MTNDVIGTTGANSNVSELAGASGRAGDDDATRDDGGRADRKATPPRAVCSAQGVRMSTVMEKPAKGQFQRDPALVLGNGDATN